MTQQGWKVYTDAKDLLTYKSDIDGKLKDLLIRGPIIIECEYLNLQNEPIDEPMLEASPKSLKLQSEVFKQLYSSIGVPLKFEVLINGKEQYWYKDKGNLTDNAPMNGDETYTFKFNPEGYYRIPETRKFTVTYKFYEIPNIVQPEQPGGGLIRGVKLQATSLTQTLFYFIFNKNLADNLKSIILSQQLNFVNEDLFMEFPLLENIEFLSEDVLYLNEHSFIDCENLTDISFMVNCKLMLQPDCDIVLNCPNIKKSILEKFKSKVNETTPEIPKYDGIANGHPYIEINGVKWATMNLGADTPEQSGLYYAWGEQRGYRGNDSYAKGLLLNYSMWDSSSDPRDPQFYKYNSNDELIELELIDDAANVAWGDGWRIPTNEEFYNLRMSTNKTMDWDKLQLKLTYNNKIILIPTGGYIDDTGRVDPEIIYLWTNKIKIPSINSNSALMADSADASSLLLIGNYTSRCHRLNIRPVFDDKLHCMIQLWDRVTRGLVDLTASINIEITSEEATYLGLSEPTTLTFDVYVEEHEYSYTISTNINGTLAIIDCNGKLTFEEAK